ncbi:hypothetical protein [Vibrio sp. D420a]|uniref:hypothetical protein n=1 Tax=Vibrio sp. D420a TaxID=2836895 RepID=UPI002555A22E|nr:hypothetical protein [Vibrio sp. D420a]
MQFLIYECLKRGWENSENTWWTYGNHLSRFLTFCEQNNLEWRDISESSEDDMLVSAYRGLCVGEFGQLLYINQDKNVVIATFSTADSAFDAARETSKIRLDAFESLANSL